MSTDRKPRMIETTFRVRFAETDQMGIVHHAAYIVYLEEGRSELGRQFGVAYVDFERAGFSLAVTEVNARYMAAARYDDRVTIRTWLEQLQSRGMTYRYEIVQADTGQTFVSATTKHICIDHKGVVRRMPQEWLDALQAMMYVE